HNAFCAGMASLAIPAMSSTPSSFSVIGHGCPGSQPTSQLTLLQPACRGSSLRVNASNLPANAALLVTGWSNPSSPLGPLPLDMAPFGMPGCTAFVSDTAITFLPGVGNAAVISTAIPNQASLVGIVFYQQLVVLDPNVANTLGAVLSDAVRIMVGG